MSVDESKRQQYLQEMGIQQWEKQTPIQKKNTSKKNANNIEKTPSNSISIPGQKHAETSFSKEGIQVQTPQDSNDDVNTLNWDALEARVLSCTACALHEGRNKAVFGVGNRNAELLVVGEAPGATEDKMGLPFVGRAGQLLDSMLFSINLDREKVYIANVLKSRPPNNRDPLPEEVAQCTPFLLRQIALIQPRLILAVGRIAAHYLLKNTESMSNLRGRVLQFHSNGKDIPLMVTYHPAYLLRSPREKRKALIDMQQVADFLKK